MSDVAIRAERLGKKYLVGHRIERESYASFRETVPRIARAFVRSALDMAHGRQLVAGDEIEDFWALKDISFEIKRGQAVGIIGKNGSGKSTLLKVLSRITEPSAGRVEIKGQLASLLEVGTGFHPELTGRENIYLNGAILGMSRKYIARRFDEIVEFAGVAKFLDTPVKRYSSGMYVRLAFAVAAFLDSDVLIVDEVLAVGDAEFQRKCLHKMGDVTQDGRTVLFVSHNMAAVQAVCSNSLLLNEGLLVAQGPTPSIISAYAKRSRIAREAGDPIDQVGDIAVERVTLEPETVRQGGDVLIEVLLKAGTATELRELALLVYSANGQRIAIVDARRYNILPLVLSEEGALISFALSGLPLIEGDYPIGVYIASEVFKGNILGIETLAVEGDFTGEHWTPYPADARGLINLSARVDVAAGTGRNKNANSRPR